MANDTITLTSDFWNFSCEINLNHAYCLFAATQITNYELNHSESRSVFSISMKDAITVPSCG